MRPTRALTRPRCRPVLPSPHRRGVLLAWRGSHAADGAVAGGRECEPDGVRWRDSAVFRGDVHLTIVADELPPPGSRRAFVHTSHAFTARPCSPPAPLPRPRRRPSARADCAGRGARTSRSTARDSIRPMASSSASSTRRQGRSSWCAGGTRPSRARPGSWRLSSRPRRPSLTSPQRAAWTSLSHSRCARPTSAPMRHDEPR